MRSVFVYGFARSGTSMLCGLIDCLGVNMLTDDPKAHQLEHNPKGMFEVKRALALGPFMSGFTGMDQKVAAEENREYILDRLSTHAPESGDPNDLGDWGIKGFGLKGMSMMLHTMRNPHVVAIFRNPVDQAKSFQAFRMNRDNVKTPLFDLVQEMSRNQTIMMEEIRLFENQGFPVMPVTYEEVKRDSWPTAQRIAEFIGIEPTEEMKEKVHEFIDPNLRTW